LNLHYSRALLSKGIALVAQFVTGLVAVKLYGRYLGVEVYGVVVVALQIVGYLPYFDGGFRMATNREILANPTAERRRGLIHFSQTFYSLLGLVLVPLGLILMFGYARTPTPAHSGQPMAFFLTLGATAALSFLGWSQIGLLVGLGAQSWFYLVNALNSVVMVGVLWVSLRQGAGVWAFPISTLAGLLVCYPVALALIRRLEPELELLHVRTGSEFWHNVREIGQAAWPCFRFQVATLFLYSVDIIMVGLICGSARDAALYGIVLRFLAIARSVLQSVAEVAWPLVTQKNETEQSLARFVMRFNALSVGSAVGAMAFTLGPFLRFYMGPEWTPSQVLICLLTFRLLVTGIGSGPGYLLLGSGEFRTLARLGQRELALAIILGLPLGLKLGTTGIALGFLLSTVGGTFSPLFYAYAKSTKQRGGQMMWRCWWRGALGCAISGTAAALFLPMASNAWRAAAIGVMAAAVALVAGATTCGLRLGAIQRRGEQAQEQPGGANSPAKDAQEHVQVELPK
jgi:O-antigen/teichoic acid export membrane protein